MFARLVSAEFELLIWAGYYRDPKMGRVLPQVNPESAEALASGCVEVPIVQLPTLIPNPLATPP